MRNTSLSFCRRYSTEGVKINAVTVQNEVDTDQDGRMPAALWGQEYEIEFVKGHLGPALERASLDTKVWILDHNYNLWGRAIAELSDPLVFKYVDGVAWHGYVGGAEAMTKVHDAFPTKGAYWTEGRPRHHQPGLRNRLEQVGTTVHKHLLRNWSQCIVGWKSSAGRKGQSEHRALPLRRPRHGGLQNRAAIAQRAILGVRALLQSDPKRRARDRLAR